ncbi:hypothetical protein NDU88_010830 [Pleurodeles waltl]|uniref:Uncharacterized protein n=1 Tax=Pleurodeles waltl TaxID=8319 RepID=A0AAV7RZB4_PLEWA|nr:hypothetical protein NDU88_010830 [Pleurodeles waltl]
MPVVERVCPPPPFVARGPGIYRYGGLARSARLQKPLSSFDFLFSKRRWDHEARRGSVRHSAASLEAPIRMLVSDTQTLKDDTRGPCAAASAVVRRGLVLQGPDDVAWDWPCRDGQERSAGGKKDTKGNRKQSCEPEQEELALRTVQTLLYYLAGGDTQQTEWHTALRQKARRPGHCVHSRGPAAARVTKDMATSLVSPAALEDDVESRQGHGPLRDRQTDP